MPPSGVRTSRQSIGPTISWPTITFSQTLGTALGDWVADAGPGYDGGALIFGAALIVVAGLYFKTQVSRVVLM